MLIWTPYGGDNQSVSRAARLKTRISLPTFLADEDSNSFDTLGPTDRFQSSRSPPQPASRRLSSTVGRILFSERVFARASGISDAVSAEVAPRGRGRLRLYGVSDYRNRILNIYTEMLYVDNFEIPRAGPDITREICVDHRAMA